MGRPVGADETGAVDRKADRQTLDGHVVDNLVIGALQEGGIKRRKRLVSLRRKAGREGHGMLLGYADIEAARGMHRRELVEARPGRHGGGDRDDLVVEARLLRERVREDGGIGGALGWLSPEPR